MQTFITVGLIGFIIFGVLFAVFPLFSHAQKTKTPKKEKTMLDNAQNIELMRNNSVPTLKARAFISLMKTAYVLVHTMGNHKGGYEYGKQAQHFSNSLSHTVISKINSFDGGRCLAKTTP